MAHKSIFDNPFDDGTKAKLTVYKNYLEKWLPVFVSRQEIIWRDIQIFDFFSGKGKDENGIKGSPLITIEVVNTFCSYIKQKDLKVRLVFNELNTEYFEALKQNVSELTQNCNYEICLKNQPFQELFYEELPSMEKSANFIFLDQNGIKEITKDVFGKITSLKQTDFLFFISSSFFKRFAKTPEFRMHFPFEPDEIEKIDYYHIHRKVLNYYKGLIPADKKYHLAPFSIKKNQNIYGLIFGSPHTFGIEKFLSVAWKLDPLTGEANFDIDNEKISSISPFLFEELNKPTKRQLFEQSLEEKVLNQILKDNWDVYNFTLAEGFLLKDANSILKKLRNKRITFEFNLITDRLHKEIIPQKITII